jgi:hypothetical protein
MYNLKYFIKSIFTSKPIAIKENMWYWLKGRLVSRQSFIEGYWRSEFIKCQDSPAYFFNHYVLINGEKPKTLITDDDIMSLYKSDTILKGESLMDRMFKNKNNV